MAILILVPYYKVILRTFKENLSCDYLHNALAPLVNFELFYKYKINVSFVILGGYIFVNHE